MTRLPYFEQAYADSPDPWRLTTPYEVRKYEVTVACLPRRSYTRGFEPGCSVGVLTAMLSRHCEHLVSTDAMEAPLGEAARRAPRADVGQGAIPEDWPNGSFDLVVLSEVLYFLTAEERGRTHERVRDSLAVGGHVVVVHWRHSFDEAECNGDDAHDEMRAFTAIAGWVRVVEHVEDDFRLEVFERAPA